jgi:diguanylate cyclase (GGDEF)-like protein
LRIGQDVLFIFALVSSFITGGLAFYSLLQKRQSAEAKIFAFLLLATTFYSFGYAFELGSSTLAGMLFWTRIEYLGIATIPSLWLVLTLQFCGLKQLLHRKSMLLLLVIPVLTLAFHYTNDLHHLFYSKTFVTLQGPFPMLGSVKGPWYWIHIIYMNCALFLSGLLLLRNALQSVPFYRKQALMMLAGSVFPWTGQFIYLAHYSPWNLDLVPFALTLTGLIVSWAIFKQQLFNLTPFAHNKVFESIRDGVLVLDLQNRLIDLNPAARSILNLPHTQPLGLGAAEALRNHPHLLEQIHTGLEQTCLRIMGRDQIQYFESRLFLIFNRKHPVGKTIILDNLTQQALLIQRLETLASIDELTNVWNRRHFMERCQRELQRLENLSQPVSLIFVDLDYFKQINDHYGHKTGDEMLRTVAQILRNGLREGDLVGRLGGEEFLVLLPATAPDQACQIAERLRSMVELAVLVMQPNLTVTASFGVTGLAAAANVSLDELLAKADSALYQAREAGRNRVVCA